MAINGHIWPYLKGQLGCSGSARMCMCQGSCRINRGLFSKFRNCAGACSDHVSERCISIKVSTVFNPAPTAHKFFEGRLHFPGKGI